jgi:phosphotransferase system HPr (HPr) family protein
MLAASLHEIASRKTANPATNLLPQFKTLIYIAQFMRIEATVMNKLGLHARPASEFVRCVRKFKSTVVIIKNNEKYSAASILDVLTANLDCGSTLVIEAEGPDAEAALERLSRLLHEFKTQEEAEENLSR